MPSPRLGHYQLSDPIGHGGMGIVYRAQDTFLDRPVAIKLLRPHVSLDPERRARFLREARAAARLNHPNVATLYEVGEARLEGPELEGYSASGNGEPPSVLYLAMEYVEGEDLHALLAEGNLPDRDTLDFAIQITEGLEAAHRAGVVHRDLKPHNIRITPERRVKILDFGLAKMLHQVVPEVSLSAETPFAPDTHETAERMILGTAPYMSPEQLQGPDVDARSDLFSFGVVLYQMASGRLPFSGGNLIEYVRALSSAEPEPLSRCRPGVSPELERIVGKLLAKEPEGRYGSADEVGQELKRLARGVPRVPPRPRWRRALTPVALGLVATLVLVFGALRWWPPATGGEGRPLTSVLVPEFESLGPGQARSDLCRGLWAGLVTRFQDLPVVVAVERDKARNLGVEAELRGTCRPTDDGGTTVALRLTDVASGVVLWSREFHDGRDELAVEMPYLAAEALGVALSPGVRRHLERSPTRSAAALNRYYRAKSRLAGADDPEDLEAAVALFKSAIEADGAFAWAWAGLSEAERQLYHQTRTEGLESEAETAARRAVELDPELPAARMALAAVYRDEGRYEEAARTLQELLVLNPRSVRAYQELAKTQRQAGKLDDAVATLKQGLGEALGMPSDYWRYWNQLGAYLLDAGALDRARKAFEQAESLAPSEVLWPRENLGTVKLMQGDYAGAVSDYEGLPETTAGVASNLGNAYYFLGRFADAERSYLRAVELRPRVPDFRANLGDAQAALGHGTEARESYRHALALLDQQLATQPGDPDLLGLRPLYLAKSGDCEAAAGEAARLRSVLPVSFPHALLEAQAYGACHERKPALDAVRRALELGAPASFVRSQAELAWLAGDPDFEKLLGAGRAGS